MYSQQTQLLRRRALSSSRCERSWPHTDFAFWGERELLLPAYTPLRTPLECDCRGRKRMKASKQINDGASTCGWGERGYASGWCNRLYFSVEL
ncbi:hypothetical protein EVAR_41598_1 [Eumeta japonica]|uniref:Uncharacterized protein n=1 Tax=Eumeta variegata TaxID=151549 RepID=A0A4C1Y6J0_EUMVA|nr:hypothetical protein EVAR_41598_1 [Eumeta japonica]